MPDRALQAGTRLHLTAPDGTRLVFTATFETVEVAGVKTVKVGFVSSDPAFSLALESAPLQLAEEKAFDLATGLPFNPFTSRTARFVLTDSAGRDWVADGTGSVRQIRTDSGDLVVSDTGIVGPGGQSVEIITSEDGGIGGMVLPDGEKLIALRDGNGRVVFFGTSAGDATRYGYDKQGRLQLLSGKETGLVDWSDENAAVLSGDVISLGTLQTAAAAGVQQATPGQGQSAFASISVRDSELASGAGHIIVGLRLSGPVDTAGLKLDGFPPLALATDGGEITALFLVERSGLLALEIPANADGPIDFAVFSAGDLDEDGEIGSLDLGQFDATPVDIDGDGDADNSDRAILLQNYGLLLNNPPSLTVDVEKTYQDLNPSIS